VARTGAAQRAPGDCGALTRKVLVMNDMTVKGKLVSAEQLLDQVFAPECKPSLRWLRTQTKAKSIPHHTHRASGVLRCRDGPGALAGKRLVRGRTLAPAEPAPV